jgi:hypothetical protein
VVYVDVDVVVDDGAAAAATGYAGADAADVTRKRNRPSLSGSSGVSSGKL